MLKTILKRFFQLLILALIVIQFFRPAKNKSEGISKNDISTLYPVPNDVQDILKTSCNDCHSNNTNYPWYSNIEPMAWMMARHINNGKNELNFSDFGSYTDRRQISKLKGIANQIKDDEMPIASYKMMHKNARLSKEQKDLIMDWMNKTADSLSANY